MKISLTGHGPLQNDSKARVPWEDVWVQYEPPSRHASRYWSTEAKRGRWAPTLIGRGELRADIEITKSCISDNPSMYSFVIDLRKLETVDELLDKRRTVAYDEEVYCRERLITRAIAERMISEQFHNLCSKEFERLAPFEFEWVASEITVTPVSVGRAKKAEVRIVEVQK